MANDPRTPEERLAAALDAFLDLAVDSNLEDVSDGESEIYEFAEPLGGEALGRLIRALGIEPRAVRGEEALGRVESIEEAVFRAAREHPKPPGPGDTRGTPRPPTGEPEGRTSALREALRPFADFARGRAFESCPDHFLMTNGSPLARRQVTAGDFKRALAAFDASAPPPTGEPEGRTVPTGTIADVDLVKVGAAWLLDELTGAIDGNRPPDQWLIVAAAMESAPNVFGSPTPLQMLRVALRVLAAHEPSPEAPPPRTCSICGEPYVPGLVSCGCPNG